MGRRMTISNRARGSLLVLLCMLITSWMGEVMAGALECYAIKDADKRAYCLARAKRDYGDCYRIKDGDRRNQCLAETKGARDRCYAIKSKEDRQLCLSQISR
jgi:hypothetical protein